MFHNPRPLIQYRICYLCYSQVVLFSEKNIFSNLERISVDNRNFSGRKIYISGKWRISHSKNKWMKGSTTLRRMHWNKSITIIARVLLSNSQSIITQRIKSSDFIRWCFFFKREKKDICVCVKEDLFFLSYPGRMLSSHWTNRQKTRRKKKEEKNWIHIRTSERTRLYSKFIVLLFSLPCFFFSSPHSMTGLTVSRQTYTSHIRKLLFRIFSR
jgi:hypothetical protein